MGSGFLAPQQFSDVIELGHQPALFLSSPVLKKIESSKLPHAEKLTALVNLWDSNLKVSYFMLGGGWPGELVSPAGLKRNYWWDENDLGYTNLLPSRSILGSSDENKLNVGDFVFYHSWDFVLRNLNDHCILAFELCDEFFDFVDFVFEKILKRV
jgi:hypothetical protein